MCVCVHVCVCVCVCACVCMCVCVCVCVCAYKVREGPYTHCMDNQENELTLGNSVPRIIPFVLLVMEI